LKKPEKHTTKSRLLLFKIIAICLPFLSVFLLEFALRLFHYGYDLSLFTDYAQNTEYRVVNPHASKRYFLDPAFAPTGNRELFLKKKAPNTLRFFVLGESTTIGYPYFHNGSFHRWLQYRLMHLYPDTRFEIINLSLTAVNSYTVLGFARELVHYQPDAVLIYSGQNEYYGGLGVGSAQNMGGNPVIVNALLRMRDSRVVQLVLNGYGSLTRLFAPRDEGQEKTRMELMVGNQQIEYGSKLFEKGLSQFKHNMNATLKLLQDHQVPVFLSTVVSNVKGLSPFIDADGAASDYHTAQRLWEEKKYTEAADLYTRAKERDALRFRAPEKINEIIRNLTNQYSRAYLVDTRKEFEVHSPHGILGDELFTDHVHPNLKGYALMSDAFYKTMKSANIMRNPVGKMTFETLLQTMPVSPIDSIAGEFRIIQLKAHWPYNDESYNRPLPEKTVEEKLAARLFRKEEDWMTVHNTLYQAYMRLNQPLKAAKVTENVVLEYAEDPVFYEQTAMVYGERGETEQAAFYLKRAFALSPSFDKARYLFVWYLILDKPDLSLPYLDYAIANNTTGMKLNTVKPLVEKALALKQQLCISPDDINLMNEIASVYLQMDNQDGASHYIEEVLRRKPANKEALEIKLKMNTWNQ